MKTLVDKKLLLNNIVVGIDQETGKQYRLRNIVTGMEADFFVVFKDTDKNNIEILDTEVVKKKILTPAEYIKSKRKF